MGFPKWHKETYESGTQTVSNRPDCAHYYVDGLAGDEEDNDNRRHFVSDELERWLNGGPIPSWVFTLTRRSGTSVTLQDDRDILAVGPYYDADHPNLLWQERDIDDAQRQYLIDCLCEGVRPNKE